MLAGLPASKSIKICLACWAAASAPAVSPTVSRVFSVSISAAASLRLRAGVTSPDLVSCSCSARARSRISLIRLAGMPVVSRKRTARSNTRLLEVAVAAASVASARLRCCSAICLCSTAMPRCQYAMPASARAMTSPAARLPVRMFRRRVAAWRLCLMKVCVSSVGVGASIGREAIQCSASSNVGERSRSPLGRPAAAQWRAASPYPVCFLIQSISAASASQSRLRLSANTTSSSKKMKLRRESVSGTCLSSTRRSTVGAKRLFSEAAKATSLAQTGEVTASGLSRNMTVSACAISAWMRFHQSSKAYISARSSSTWKPRSFSAASSRSANAMSLRE